MAEYRATDRSVCNREATGCRSEVRRREREQKEEIEAEEEGKGTVEEEEEEKFCGRK